MNTCPTCQQPFDPTHHHQKYCTDKCHESAHRSQKYRWRDEHPEAVDKSRRKRQLKSSNKRLRQLKMGATKRVQLSRLVDKVRRHLSKGRSPAAIAIWENIPMSEVTKIVTQITEPITALL